MLTIKDRSKVPRELYDYTVPETQTAFKAHGLGLLLHKIREHYTANKIPVPENLLYVVEADWCSRYPYHCEDPSAVVQKEREDSDVLTKLIAAAAIPAADALATISKALGITCSRCQKRHRIIKEMQKRGFTETLKLLKETLHA